jgi:hypothetical protein
MEVDIINDVPPNSSRDPKVGPQNKTTKEEESWGTLFNSQHFKGRRRARALEWD